MTDATRANLRRLIEKLVTSLASGGTAVLDTDSDTITLPAGLHRRPTYTLTFTLPDGEVKPLDATRIMALTVLVGEPDDVITAALADCLIESGHEYATACYERGRGAGRPDDDQPRTVEWLISVGFHHTTESDPDDAEWCYDYGIGDREHFILGTLNEYMVVVGHDPGGPTGPVIIGQMPTRGHVRRIAAALGLALNESE